MQDKYFLLRREILLKNKFMEIAFLFDGRMAILSSVEPKQFALHVPKGKNSPSLIADFLDTCPGIEVEKVSRAFEKADVISFRSEGQPWEDVVEEVCNAINDIYDTDIRVVNSLLTPPPAMA